LLSIGEQCKGYASQNILHPVTTVQNSKLIDIIPETKIITGGQNLEQNTTFNVITSRNMGKIEKLHDLNSISSSLDDINRDIDYQLIKQSVREVNRNHNYIFYSIIILFVFLFICAMIKKYCISTTPPPTPLRDYNPVHFDTIKVTEV